MAKKGFSVDQLQRPREQVISPRSPSYELSTAQPVGGAEEALLPPEAANLVPKMRELALRYVGSRRRVGEALLDACRYLSDARDQAEEGQWYLFLQVTGTSHDQAEAQINIHLRARQHPEFAEKIRSGWLNQTVASELAKSSTPSEVFTRLLEAPIPPRVADVRRARRDFQSSENSHKYVDNPDYPGSFADEIFGGTSDSSDVLPHEKLVSILREVAATMEVVARDSTRVPTSGDVTRALDMIEHAVSTIRVAIDRR